MLEVSAREWPDPKQYKTKEELVLQYTYASGHAKGIKTLIEELKGSETTRKTLQDKLDGKSDYEI